MVTSFVGGQNAKDSWWICRRGTPAERRERVTAAVIPGGPHK
jgi:hypothetical protein